MDQPQHEFVMRVLDRAKDLTLATIRPDGYPQATVVSFAHEDMALYAGIGRSSQKAANIRANAGVALTITLSMSALAEVLDDPAEASAARSRLEPKFPQASEWVGPNMAAEVAFLRIIPQMVSVIDYSKGFGHTELVYA